MKFFRKVKGFLFPIRQTSLKDITMKPGDVVACFYDNNKPYGICGAIHVTQVDLNRQIEFKPQKLIGD